MNELATTGKRVLDAFTQVFLGVEVWRIIADGMLLIFAMAVRKSHSRLLVRHAEEIDGKSQNTLDDQVVDAIDSPARLSSA